eukprot:CCRYP_002116-RA/>CCRYP_002116-RA protein AED:0.42 eAED:0.42 QI:0/0/0/1/0/0/2/0/336
MNYVGKEHTNHLINTLKGHYEISMDWNGQRYIALTPHWDYRNHLVCLSMPGYCGKAGQCFQHAKPNKPQHQPYPSAPRSYGSKQQLCASADTAPALGKQQKTFVQEVIGVFLYYAWAVDCTMLTALGSLTTQQANPTKTTLHQVYQFLDYALSHPNAGVTYRASDMVLTPPTVTPLISQKGTHAAVPLGTSFFPKMTITPTTMGPSSKPPCPPRQSLNWAHYTSTHTKYPQPPTPIQTDNSTALGVVNNTIQPKRTKAMDMRFQWLLCHINHKHFWPYWQAGATNLADYITKHHPVWPLFLTADQPLLPHWKLRATCIPHNTLLCPPIIRPAAGAA